MAKKTIIRRNIDPSHYIADAFISWCFDGRFSSLLGEFVASQGWNSKNVDYVKMAGGAKVFATPEAESEGAHYCGQIEKSIKLHHTKKIVLMAHANCGAYGKHFDDEKKEEEFYFGELDKAKKTVSGFLKEKNIDIPVEAYYADFSGLHLVS